ncbi:hypothetical protein TCA2_0703 [Paenibacillus sp. TCA20]|nr:hypothetical protein TCA2_0703 [Paenibacillus sp. TCA20]
MIQMDIHLFKELLCTKLDDLDKRTLHVLHQLNDDEVNYRYNEASNSIANLVVHISGNIDERVRRGIRGSDVTRDRDAEFDVLYRTRDELIEITKESYQDVRQTIELMSEEDLMKTQVIRDQERSNLDILFACVTHFSEHLGQMLYLAKMLKDQDFSTASVPKRK